MGKKGAPRGGGALPQPTAGGVGGQNAKKGGKSAFSLWDGHHKVPPQYQVWTQSLEGSGGSRSVQEAHSEATSKFMSAAAKEKLASTGQSHCMLDVHAVLSCLLHYGMRPEGSGKQGTGDVALAVFLSRVLAFTQIEFDLTPCAVIGVPTLSLAVDPKMPSGLISKSQIQPTLRYEVQATYSFANIPCDGETQYVPPSQWWRKEQRGRSKAGAHHGVVSYNARNRDDTLQAEAANQTYWTRVIQQNLEKEVPSDFKPGVIEKMMIGVGFLGNLVGFLRLTNPDYVTRRNKVGRKKMLFDDHPSTGPKADPRSKTTITKRFFSRNFVRGLVFGGHVDALKAYSSYLDELGSQILQANKVDSADGAATAFIDGATLLMAMLTNSGSPGGDFMHGLVALAVAGGSKSMVRYLLHRFSEPWCYEHRNDTGDEEPAALVDFSPGAHHCHPLTIAIHCNDREMVSMLIQEFGAKVTSKTYVTVLEQSGICATMEGYHSNYNQFGHVPSKGEYGARTARIRRTGIIALATIVARGTAPGQGKSAWDVLSDLRLNQDSGVIRDVRYAATEMYTVDAATPLHLMEYHPAPFQLLWDQGMSCVVETIATDDTQRVGKRLILHWATLPDGDGLFPLHSWAKRGQYWMVLGYLRALKLDNIRIDGWLPVNQLERKSGATALIWATGGGHTGLAKILIDFGALVSPQDAEGYNALDWYNQFLDEDADENIKPNEELLAALEQRLDFENQWYEEQGEDAEEGEALELKLEAAVAQVVNDPKYNRVAKPTSYPDDGWGYNDIPLAFPTWEEAYVSLFSSEIPTMVALADDHYLL